MLERSIIIDLMNMEQGIDGACLKMPWEKRRRDGIFKIM